MGNFSPLVLHESNSSVHLIIAVSAKRHVTIVAFHFSLGLASIAFPLSTLPVPLDDGINLRTLAGTLLAWLDGAATLAGELLLEPVLAGRADERLAAASEEGGHLVGVAELA